MGAPVSWGEYIVRMLVRGLLESLWCAFVIAPFYALMLFLARELKFLASFDLPEPSGLQIIGIALLLALFADDSSRKTEGK